MKLFNLNPRHTKEGQEIDSIHLLHFLADAVKDWECDATLDDCKGCPLHWSVTRMPEGVIRESCILEAIKDQAFVWLEKPGDEE